MGVLTIFQNCLYYNSPCLYIILINLQSNAIRTRVIKLFRISADKMFIFIFCTPQFQNKSLIRRPSRFPDNLLILYSLHTMRYMYTFDLRMQLTLQLKLFKLSSQFITKNETINSYNELPSLIILHLDK